VLARGATPRNPPILGEAFPPGPLGPLATLFIGWGGVTFRYAI
jgi:hypothetical protein